MNIGGFFASVALKPDTASFQKGITAIGGVSKSIVKFKGDFKSTAQDIIGWAMKLGAAFLGMGAAAAKFGTMTANKMGDLKAGAFKAGGMNPLTFKLWGDAADIAGSSAESMAEALTTLNKALQSLQFGDASKLQSMSKAFAVGFGDQNFLNNVLKAKPDERITKIIEAYYKAPDKQKASEALDQAGLSSLADILARSNNLFQAFNLAKSSNMITGGDINNASNSAMSGNVVGKDLNNFFTDMGAQVAINTKGPLDDFHKWFVDNKEALDAFAKAVGEAASALLKFIGEVVKFVFGDKGTVMGQQRFGLFDIRGQQQASAKQEDLYKVLDAAHDKKDFSGFRALSKDMFNFAVSDILNPAFSFKLGENSRQLFLPESEGFSALIKGSSPDQLKQLLDMVTIEDQRKNIKGDLIVNLDIGGDKRTAVIPGALVPLAQSAPINMKLNALQNIGNP